MVTANPDRGTDRVRADLASLGVGTLAGEPADLEASRPAGALAGQRAARRRCEVSGEAPVRRSAERRPGVAVEMLTSGTTGPPKRVPLTYETMSRVLAGTKHYERNPSRRAEAAARA